MITGKRRFFYFLAAFFLLVSTFLNQPAQVYAQDWRDSSADVDGDGLPNIVEENGWYNAAGGLYVTNYLDADSDDDGLTDGQEKLYDTNPLNDHSPGIYVEYQEGFQTKKYFPWQRYGSKHIALPYPGSKDSVVVRRGTTLSVGGPADAFEANAIEIDKSISSLTTLTPVRDHCTGRWNIYVPEDGTVGIYTITVESKSLNLYVIFQRPTGLSDTFVDAFVYDDHPDNGRDSISIGYYENDPPEYTHTDYGWIPVGEWINHGYAWRYETRHYSDYVFEDHVIPIINGQTNTWDAANALGQHVDEVTCFGYPRPLSNSWCVLHPHLCAPYTNINQCTNIANLLVSFNRAAGIPSRPVFTDWRHSTFDHSTEVWTKRPTGGVENWYVMRGYDGGEGSCSEAPNPPYYPPSYTGGYNPLRNTSGWYPWGQGVYAAGENWPWDEVNYGTYSGNDDFRQASWGLDKVAKTGKIVKKDWWETRFVDYWDWPSEPQVIGTPPNDWPSCCPPPPVAEFTGSPISGTVPLTVTFTDQSTGHVRSRSWDFGDSGTSTSQNPSHTYEATGTFTVSLTVTGAGGSDTETKIDYIYVEDGLGGLGAFSALVALQSGQVAADDDVDPDSVVQFGQIVADYGVDLNGDGRFDQLVFVIQVNAGQVGDYWIRGRLEGGLEAIGHVYLAEGYHTVELLFDGMDIYMNKIDGPYSLEALWITDIENPSPSDFAENELAYVEPAYQTSSYKFSDFGIAGATLSGDYRHYTVDTDGDGYADALVVETSLDIEKVGTYTVQGVLFGEQGEVPSQSPYDEQGEMLSQATWTGSGPSVTLQFNGLRDTVGLYALQHLHVRNAAGQVTDGIREPYVLGEIPELSAKPISLGVEVAIPPDPTQIAPLFVITDTGYSDAGVDTDGDGQFDQLVITVNVEVEPGEGGQAYRIEGWLVDTNNSLVSWTISDPQVLAEGVQSLSLAFDGRIINEHGVDGPFTLIALKALPGDTYSVLDEIDVAYTTSAYDHDDFEEPVIVPTIGILEDDMENGAGKWTWDDPPWSLNDSMGYSSSHAWKANASGADGSLATISLDLTDYVNPTLRFKTCYNMESPNDVGYLEVWADGLDWTRVATYTNSTSSWNTALVDLGSYGNVADLQLRFNANSQSALLWYVDDVYLNASPDIDSVYLPIILK